MKYVHDEYDMLSQSEPSNQIIDIASQDLLIG